MKNYIILHGTTSTIAPTRYDFGENLEACLKFLTTMLINDPDLDPEIVIHFASTMNLIKAWIYSDTQ